MPTNQRISEMPSAATLNGNDILEIAQVNAGSTSGYASAKTTITAVGNEINKEIQYADLNTTAKTIVGAINEAAGAGSGGNLEDLGNVNITNPTDGQVLKYNATNDKWINGAGGGGGNADIVHLTQAEYDALPDSKLTDDKVYMITDT